MSGSGMSGSGMSRAPGVRPALLVVFAVALWAACGATAARAQGDTTQPADTLLMVHASVEPDTGTVGDRLVLTLTATHDLDTALAFPRLAGEIAPFEVLDVVIYPADETVDGVYERRDVVITSFQTGEHVIPGLAFHAVMSGGDTTVVRTRPVGVVVRSVLTPEDLEGELTPRDIKPPRELPRAKWPWLAAAATLIALYAAWRFLRRLRRRPEAEETQDATDEERRRAAHVVALERLKAIRRGGLLERGEIERFYVALTDAARRYIGDRFGVPAIDRTTAELEPELRAAALGDERIVWLRGLLERADLSKFARTAPSTERAGRDLDEVEEFIRVTRFRDVEEDDSVGGARSGSSEEDDSVGGARSGSSEEDESVGEARSGDSEEDEGDVAIR